MKKKTGVLWGLIVCSILFLSCASKLGKDSITVYGMVYDGENNPVQDYAILINERTEAVTDFGGRFIIYDVPKGMCRISGKKTGYSSTSENLYLDGKKIIYLRIQNLEGLYSECFDFMKNGKYTEAEKIADSILKLAPEDENGTCFLSVIEDLRKIDSKSVEALDEI